ncbi:MFS transporter [Bacillus pseudomycoides]|uniref:MFS transporter n=1 Tax=Bacillus pseudomycoides TaxID=64104 RepID=UPI000BF544FF|nr:MFS transporter [Bacillus pseudomycoides]PEP54633.1 MFS transporter [Bacillus pseudomycoides]PHC96415.1 MFS transporter [Bacillus pseudomycoides]
MQKQKTRNEPISSYKWIVLLIATISQTCATFVTYGIGPLASLWQQVHHISQFQIGLLVSVVNIGPIFSMLLFGNLMDRHGERWIVGGGSILLGASMLFAYPATNYTYVVAILLFVGIWYGTAQPGGSKAIVKWFPPQRRGLAMGIRQTGIPIGGALASTTLPFFFYEYGLPSVILVQALVAISGGLLFILFYREEHSSIQKTEAVSFFTKLKKIQRNYSLYPIFLIGISMMSLQMVLVSHLMSYLTNEVHTNLHHAGTLLSIVLIGGMFGRILLAWASDKIFKGNRIIPLQITIVITVLLLFCTSYVMTYMIFGLLVILCFFFGFFAIGWFSLFIVFVSERSDPQFIGLTVSFALTLNQFAIVLAPTLFGIFVDYFHSYTVPFSILAFFIALSGIWLTIIEYRNKPLQ